MERIPEPELMEEKGQVQAYANADFDEPHEQFITLLSQRLGQKKFTENVLDLGCGPGDICIRFARKFTQCNIIAVDGSQAMLQMGKLMVKEHSNLRERIQFVHSRLPEMQIPSKNYQLIMSNSLLHHLGKAIWLWECIQRNSQAGTAVFMMDLRRPQNKAEAEKLVDQHSGDEPEVLRKDFCNSLLAAYTPEEVKQQLFESKLKSLRVESIGDRHLIAWGTL